MFITWKTTTHTEANLLSYFTNLFFIFSLSLLSLSRTRMPSHTLLCQHEQLFSGSLVSGMVQLLWCSEPESCRSLSFWRAHRCVRACAGRVRLFLHAASLFPCISISRLSVHQADPLLEAKTSYTGASFHAPVVAVIAEAALTLLISAPFARCVGVSTKHSVCMATEPSHHSQPPTPPPTVHLLLAP